MLEMDFVFGCVIGSAAVAITTILLIEYLNRYVDFKSTVPKAKMAEKMRDKVTVDGDIKDIAESYMDGDGEKEALRGFAELVGNIEYEERDGVPTPEEVTEDGKADCVGKSILFASLAESIGMETQFAFEDTHVFVFAEGGDGSLSSYGYNGGKLKFVER